MKKVIVIHMKEIRKEFLILLIFIFTIEYVIYIFIYLI